MGDVYDQNQTKLPTLFVTVSRSRSQLSARTLLIGVAA